MVNYIVPAGGIFAAMYKYQCSRQECRTEWYLGEGHLNGFVLTCPICGKGRGVYLAQEKRDHDKKNIHDEIIIIVDANYIKSAEEMEKQLEIFKNRYSINILNKNIEVNGREIVCALQISK